LKISMQPKNYYGIDVIHTKEDTFKILDMHGLSDAISFSEKAGYKPRLSRIYRFMDMLKEISQGRKILYLSVSKERKPYNFPKALEEFYDSLPKGAAHLEWRAEQKVFDENLTHGVFKKEIEFLVKAARRSKVEFIFGDLFAYSPEDGVLFEHINLKRMEMWKELAPFDDVGLLVLWGHDYERHPEAGIYWYQQYEPARITFPVLNSLQISYALNTHVPKWTARNFIENPEEVFPRETYLGMGISTPEELEEFRQTLKPGGIVAVKKPLCTHMGVSVSFLSQEDIKQLIEQEKKLDLQGIRAKVEDAMDNGFDYTDEDKKNDAFKWYWMLGEKWQYPVAELGASILQEYFEAMPTKSNKTGQLHQGVIRAQVLAGKPIAVMHRFPKKPCKKGEILQMTRKDVPTFWERTSDELEERVVRFLNPILAGLENKIETYDLLDIARIGRAKYLK